MWEYLRRHLGLAGVRTALHRLEISMGKLSDELDDISRRVVAGRVRFVRFVVGCHRPRAGACRVLTCPLPVGGR